MIEDDDGRGIRPDLIEQVRHVLTALGGAADMDDLRGPPGWRVHALSGRRSDTWGIGVSGNWRLTFRIEDGHVVISTWRTIADGRVWHEDRHDATHPGSFIRVEILEELGLSVARGAEILGVSQSALSDLVEERAGLSPEMAFRIEKAFGVSMDMLLRMQAWRDSHAMRRRGAEISVGCYDLEVAGQEGEIS